MPGTASEPPDSHPAEPQLRVSDQPPGGPRESAYTYRLLKLNSVIGSREVAVTTPPSRRPQSWNGEGEVLGVVPLLRAEGSEEESQFGLVASVPEGKP